MSTYKKYDVSLPFKTGLPEHVTFTCIIYLANFNSKKSLQRHIKNIHDAFSEVSKGTKRKSLQNEIPSKKLKKTDRISQYLLYN